MDDYKNEDKNSDNLKSEDDFQNKGDPKLKIT